MFTHKKVLKDLNFTAIQKELNYPLLVLDHLASHRIEHTLKEDTDFLRQLNLMDYSLLLTIEQSPQL